MAFLKSIASVFQPREVKVVRERQERSVKVTYEWKWTVNYQTTFQSSFVLISGHFYMRIFNTRYINPVLNTGIQLPDFFFRIKNNGIILYWYPNVCNWMFLTYICWYYPVFLFTSSDYSIKSCQ